MTKEEYMDKENEYDVPKIRKLLKIYNNTQDPEDKEALGYAIEQVLLYLAEVQDRDEDGTIFFTKEELGEFSEVAASYHSM